MKKFLFALLIPLLLSSNVFPVNYDSGTPASGVSSITVSGSTTTVSGTILLFNGSIVKNGDTVNGSSTTGHVDLGNLSTTGPGGCPVVAGGWNNTAGESASGGNFGCPTVGGGSQNSATSYGATVGGGASNSTSGPYSTVSGGTTNSVVNFGGVIGGGESNSITTTGTHQTIIGGKLNVISGGSYQSILGGISNSISSAGGQSATLGSYGSVTHDGAILINATNASTAFASNATSEFAVKADGGMRFRVSSSTISFNPSSATFSVQLIGNGTTVADSASSGQIGEFTSSSTVVFANIATTNQFGNVSTVTLTSGDWDLSGCITLKLNGAAITDYEMAISSFSANTTTDHTEGYNWLETGAFPIATANSTLCAPRYRVTLAGTTVFYLKAKGAYTVATPQALGTITARRPR